MYNKNLQSLSTVIASRPVNIVPHGHAKHLTALLLDFTLWCRSSPLTIGLSSGGSSCPCTVVMVWIIWVSLCLCVRENYWQHKITAQYQYSASSRMKSIRYVHNKLTNPLHSHCESARQRQRSSRWCQTCFGTSSQVHELVPCWPMD